jgi:hypothetical protein
MLLHVGSGIPWTLTLKPAPRRTLLALWGVCPTTFGTAARGGWARKLMFAARTPAAVR